MATSDCPLCHVNEASRQIWQNDSLRIVWGAEADHPCLVQVVWQAHAQEMCDLSPADKEHVMQAVFAVEAAMKAVFKPKKLNMASLGNWVPHLHWHIIPRWEDDAHWPNSIWAAKQRDASQRGVADKAELALAIVQAMKVQAT